MRFVITGAARGIGRGLTRLLLQQGHSVYLVDANVRELLHTLKLCRTWAPPDSGQAIPFGDIADGFREDTIKMFATFMNMFDEATDEQVRFKGRVVDLSDREGLPALVEDVAFFFGGSFDVLINNAFATPHTWADGGHMEDGVGVPDTGSSEVGQDSSNDDIEAQWDLKIAVGLTAPFLLARRFTGLLRKGKSGTTNTEAQASTTNTTTTAAAAATSTTQTGDGGSSSSDPDKESPGCIINISSTRARQAEPDHEAYSAAKAGLIGLTQSMAVSLGSRYGIRVNAILPGWINVDHESATGDRNHQHWSRGLTADDHSWHPAGRVGRVEDVASAVMFLDGGVSRKMVYPE